MRQQNSMTLEDWMAAYLLMCDGTLNERTGPYGNFIDDEANAFLERIWTEGIGISATEYHRSAGQRATHSDITKRVQEWVELWYREAAKHIKETHERDT